jgi:dTDP-4-amino-4,6-dideoxygalactose transaminase
MCEDRAKHWFSDTAFCLPDHRVPVSAPKRAADHYAEEIRVAIDRVLASGWFLGGEEVEAFENEFATYLDAEHAVAVSSGTDAIELALRASGVRPGDRVATVSLTAVATLAAIERAGARPLLVDVDPRTLTLDAEALARLCARIPVKAVVPVHIYGLPANMPRILEIAAEFGAVVVEDCAQAHGAKLEGKACGTWGDIAAFSFYPTKNLGGLGDGGAVVTSQAALADRIRLLREYGWRQRHLSEVPGFNSRLDALQAAVLRCKLRRLEAGNARRAAIARRYDEALRGSNLHAPAAAEGATPVYHQYVVRSAQRDALRSHLASWGVETALHYEHPAHLQPAYSKQNLTAGERLPHTEAACREVVSVPVFPELTDSEVDRVAQALATFHQPEAAGDAPTVVDTRQTRRRLPVSRPAVGDEELRGVAEVFESAWLGQGSKVLEFEEALRELLGNRHVVAVSSGTAALHLALDAIGVKAGDEVIVPSLTFCATVQAITAVGAIPVFCEIELDTLNIDVTDAASRITPRTRAIMPVHSCGIPCDMDELLPIAMRHGIAVVEDAAHAFGSSYRGRPIGSFGDIACFSFDPIKNITCGEGGAIVLAGDALADLLRRKRLLGINRDRWQRSGDDRPWSYRVEVQGFRYHMSNINAAIGLAQLRRLPWFRRRKQELVRRYNERFAVVEGVQLLRWQLDDCFPFSYVLRVANGRRDDLHSFLDKSGIGTSVNYVPNHMQPFFAAFSGRLPKTQRAFGEIINLPLFTDMTDAEFERVATAVTSYFQ